MSLDLDNVSTAIYGSLSVNAGLVALGAEVYRNIAPEGTAMPYIVWNEIIISPDNTFTGNYWNIIYQFDCWAEKTATRSAQSFSAAVANALCAAMDGASYTITGYNHICNRYESQQVIYEVDIPAVKNIVEYRVIIGD